MTNKSFASDNYAGIHPIVLKAIVDANVGHVQAYGNDVYTQKAVALFKELLGQTIDVYFVCTGTAANVLSLAALVKSYQAVICAQSAHINSDECGALEYYAGTKLLVVPHVDGKLTVENIQDFLINLGNQHKVQPKVISISQTTEFGSVYSLDEIKKIVDFAHGNNMYVHMDGARIANAVASLNGCLAACTMDLGVDVLTFGGTKNGMMLGEAIIFCNQELSKDFEYIRKQGMQLVSKKRFIAAQFIALLSDNLWIKNAWHANEMATLLANKLKEMPHITITRPVQANAVFAVIDSKIITQLQTFYSFYVWNRATSEVRLMTSWDTIEQDVLGFVAAVKRLIS